MHLRTQVTQPSDPSYRIIGLTRGQVTLVDTEDFEYLNQFKWCAVWMPHTKSYYVDRHAPTQPDGRRPHMLMHRVILGVQKGVQVDHEDHDTLNNRRYSLRPASQSQNMRNSRRHMPGGLKGVHWEDDRKKWRACIHFDGKLRHLGGFDRQEDAIFAYQSAALKYYGEFAHLDLSPAPAQQ